MIIPSYKHLGGVHPDTAALKNILASMGVKAPHTGKPFTEAMLLGIGGGLGAGYILWEFKKYASAILVLAFRNNWQYPVKFMQNLCGRLGAKLIIKETAGQKAAASNLTDALAKGKPVIAWVDQHKLPYLHVPDYYDGCFFHVVGVYGIDEAKGEVLIDDRGTMPFMVGAEQFAKARARIVSFKNRLMMVEAPAKIDLHKAILVGIRDGAAHLSKPSTSFSLPAFLKWAKLMTDAKDQKAWSKVFAKPLGLYSTLRSIYEGISVVGTSGGCLRGLYADFLEESGTVLNKPKLKEVAAQYKALDKMWNAFAEAALPDAVKPLKETKTLLVQRDEALKTKGQSGLEELEKVGQQLHAMREAFDKKFPMNDSDIATLFADMQKHLYGIYETEVKANAALRDVV